MIRFDTNILVGPMALFLMISLAVVVWLPCEAVAQESDELLVHLQSAFGKGNAQELSQHIPPSVEIALFGAARFYSKGQAGLLMKQFFADYPPAGFVIKDFTKTTNGWFIEAQTIVKESKQVLRVYVRLRKDRTGWKIREILIEDSDE